MPAKTKTPATDPFSTTEKVMQTFRMPRDLVAFLRSEADRTALKMERYEYILHLLFQRSLELREKGPGFDAPGAERKKK